MKQVTTDEVRSEPNPLQVHEVRKPLSKVLETSELALNYFELAPGESFSGGMHTHHDQEEVFYVLSGTATFETTGGPGQPRETTEVPAGGAIRFAPGDWQVGRNDTDERVSALALGAPGPSHDWDGLESLLPCPACGEERAFSVEMVDGRFEMACTDCGHEF